jgi:hypothetical protein
MTVPTQSISSPSVTAYFPRPNLCSYGGFEHTQCLATPGFGSEPKASLVQGMDPSTTWRNWGFPWLSSGLTECDESSSTT